MLLKVVVRGDPHGKMSDRGCVVDRETVALDEWLIVCYCSAVYCWLQATAILLTTRQLLYIIWRTTGEGKASFVLQLMSCWISWFDVFVEDGEG